MGFFAKLKDVFASSASPKFLGDDGSLIVIHDDSIERIWGRKGSEDLSSSEQRCEIWALEGITAALSADAAVLTISSEKFSWEIPVGPESVRANAAALFANRVNDAVHGPEFSLGTFVHSR
jgi:hypothetical protein